MNAPEWTPDEIEAAIQRALAAHDVKAVESLMVMLAVRDPQRAEDMLTILKAGLILADRAASSIGDDT